LGNRLNCVNRTEGLLSVILEPMFFRYELATMSRKRVQNRDSYYELLTGTSTGITRCRLALYMTVGNL